MMVARGLADGVLGSERPEGGTSLLSWIPERQAWRLSRVLGILNTLEHGSGFRSRGLVFLTEARLGWPLH